MSNVTTIDFSKKEQKDGSVSIIYTDGTVDIIQCSSINASEAMPNFIELWKSNADGNEHLIGFISSVNIKKIALLFGDDNVTNNS